jgi:hypothetical protein
MLRAAVTDQAKSLHTPRRVVFVLACFGQFVIKPEVGPEIEFAFEVSP